VGDDANFEPVAKVTTVPWPGNAEGEAVYTRPTMAKFIVEDGDLPEMKEKASEALEAAGFPKTDRGKVEAILAFARSAMSYVPDSPMRQTCYRPRYMVCAQGAKLCVRIGNCVNMNCALGALLRAAGFDVKVQGIEYGGGAQDHVNILVRLPDEGGKWYEADATTGAAVGYVSPGKKHVYDPLNPAIAGAGAAGAAFIGAGKAMQTVSMNDALFGRAVGAAVPATNYAQAQIDLAAVQAGASAGDTYLAASEYANAVQAYQAVGVSGATVVGPEIDLAGAPNATQPFTQKAWVLNAALAAINSSAPAQSDAQQAQSLIGQMIALYQQAIAAGTNVGPGPGPSGGPGTSANSALYLWVLGLGALAGASYGVYRYVR